LKGWNISNIWEKLNIPKSIKEKIKTIIKPEDVFLSFGAVCFVFQVVNKNLKIKVYRTVILSVVLFG
jgi:hypothetical protein